MSERIDALHAQILATAPFCETWDEVADAAGCSRQWAARVARRAGVALGGREPLTEFLSLRVSARLVAALEQLADAEGLESSVVHRRLLRDGLRRSTPHPFTWAMTPNRVDSCVFAANGEHPRIDGGLLL